MGLTIEEQETHVNFSRNDETDGLKIDDRITDRIESTTYPIRLPDEPIRKVMRQQAKQDLLNDILNNRTDKKGTVNS